MYRIGLFSKINKVTIKALRYYDEIGLLEPAFVDEQTGYRYYTSEQLPALHQIIGLRQLGFSIQEITAILEGQDMRLIFSKRQQELEESIANNQQQLSQILYYLENMKEDFNMTYQVALKELPEVIVYSKRMVIPDYDAYFQIIPQIGQEVAAANPGLQCASPEYCFVIYHDGEYKEQNINVEFCEAVTAKGEDTDTIKFKTMPKIPVAACVYHKGPYSTIGSAYAQLFKWISDNGYTPCDNPREAYIDGIWNKENAEEWITELQVPVRKE